MKQPLFFLMLLLLPLFIAGCQSEEESHWEAEYKKAEAIGTGKAYVDFLSRVPFHKPQYDSVTSAVTALGELANSSLVNSCTPDTFLVDPSGLDEVIDLIIVDKQTIPINLVISENKQDKELPTLKIRYSVNHISATYSPSGRADSLYSKTLSSGANLKGTIRIDDGTPYTIERIIEPMGTITNTSKEGAKKGAHRAAFKLGNLKAAFAKSIIENCSPAAVAAVYFDYSDFNPRVYPPMDKLWFKEDATLDEFVMTNLEGILPIIYMSFDGSLTDVGARDHIVKLMSAITPEISVQYLRVMLHLSLRYPSSHNEKVAIQALNRIGTPQATSVLAEYHQAKKM